MKQLNKFLTTFKEFIKTRNGKIITVSVISIVLCFAFLITFLNIRNNSVKVNVEKENQNAVSPISVELNKKSLSLKEGEHDKLTASVEPSAAKDKTVMWTSSDKSVATVQDGLVTAQGEGNAEITASSTNGKNAVCSVSVAGERTSSSVSSSSESNNTAVASSSENKEVSSKSVSSSKSSTQTAGKSTSSTAKSTTKGKTAVKSGKSANTTTSSTKKPVNKEFYKTVNGCNVKYNPAYRSAEVFVDLSSVNKQYCDDDLIVKTYKNGTIDNSSSGNYQSIGYGTPTQDVVVATNEKWVDNTAYAVKTSFRIECYHNATHFKTITFTVDENGFC